MKKIIHSRFFHLFTLVLLAFMGSLVLIQPSSAHTALVSSTPVAGAILQEFPKEIALEFNEPLLTLGKNQSNYFELLSPSGESVTLQEFSVAQSTLTASVVTVPTTGGSYEIAYRVVAADGHVIRGSINFQYESQESMTGEEEVLAPTVTKKTSIFPDSVLIGLILVASMVAVLIYMRSGKKSQS